MSDYIFRALLDSEFDEGLTILLEVGSWLNSKGIRQWTENYTREIYPLTQQRGENYALLRNDAIIALVTLSPTRPRHWVAESAQFNANFLSRLAVHRKYRDQRFGSRTIDAAKDFERDRGMSAILLEIVYSNQFLLDYYTSHGFVIVDRKDVDYASGRYDMGLMKAEL